MRLLGRTLFVAAIVIVIVGLVATIGREVGRQTPVAELPLETRESTAYTVNSRRQLEFRLSGHADQVRVRTHGLVPRVADEAPGGSHGYALSIAILSTDGTLLAERTEHYRTTVVRFRNAETGQLERVNFVDDPSVDVIGTGLTILNLSSMPSAEVLRIRLMSADADVREVGVRVYEPEAVPEHSIAASWQRLSVPQRERLAEGNVYPMSLLTPDETAAILTRRWRPVGPTGIEGEDYGVRTLVIREEGGGRADRPVLPAGLYVDDKHSASLVIPERGRYLVRASAVPGRPAESGPASSLSLQGAAAPEMSMSWSGSSIEQTVELDAGPVAVRSDRPAAVRVYRITGGDPVELTPERRMTRAFRVVPSGPLDFAVNRRFDRPAILRIDLRRWLNGPQDPGGAETAVTYSLLDSTGTVVEGGVIHVGAAPASDAGLVDDPAALLSAPVQHEFALAAGVVRLRLAADRPVYVAAYNRLETDIGATATGTVGLARAPRRWFSFMPVEGKKLIRDGGSVVVVENLGTPAVGASVDADAP